MASWKMWMRPALASPGRALPAARDQRWRRLLLAIESDELGAATKTTHAPRRAPPQGEKSAFEAFFRAHEHDIFTYLWRMTSDEQAAYDLAQETFLRAWQRFAVIRDYERPGGWLFRVATHLALNHLRSRTTTLGAALSLDAAGGALRGLPIASAHADPGAQVADADAVRRALLALAPRQRAALVLREIYGLPHGEVATALGISAGAAKTLLWRARDEFRERYAKEAR
ncbi:MAG: RNA polymerase sigma factor [Chloroflexota bacterium]|nr:RNA polymerase sigma factor [Chloroflexota bacterium]